jgi:hypothetical protein
MWLEVQVEAPYYYATSLIPSPRARMYCTTRSAIGLIHTGTQWTMGSLQITQNRLNKRNSRTHKNGLARLQTNS